MKTYGTKNVFIATGSFQPPLHDGQTEYLKAAYQRFLEAKKTDPDAKFFVITGPADGELSPSQMKFSDRAVELSKKTGIPQSAFKSHKGRPKLNKESAEIWREHFFDPLLDIGIKPDQCQIIAVKKADDISPANNTGGVHYLDWLQQRWPGVAVTDITSEMTHLDLSSSALRLEKPETDWDIKNDPDACEAVARLAQKFGQEHGITGNPDKAAHKLGTVTLKTGEVRTAHVVHAVDSVITDGTYLITIIRKNPPGKGLRALVGGFIDPLKINPLKKLTSKLRHNSSAKDIESAFRTSARETIEESGLKLKSKPILIGTRNMYRPNDVRIATNDSLEKKYGIKKGDIFMVSTQAVLYPEKDLNTKRVKKQLKQDGDDASDAKPAEIGTLTKDSFGIPDHWDMLQAALTEFRRRHPSPSENLSRPMNPRPY